MAHGIHGIHGKGDEWSEPGRLPAKPAKPAPAFRGAGVVQFTAIAEVPQMNRGSGFGVWGND